MDRADVAILISLASAFVTAGGLFWQVMLYRLSGARLNVALRPCLVDEYDTIFRGPSRGWPKTTPAGFFPSSRWTIELAEVTVTNVGRAPISVENVSLDIGRWPRRLFGRWTVAGVPVSLSKGIRENHCRLEPGDSVTAYLDVWRAIQMARTLRPRVVVRASAQPVGRRAKRSLWIQRWTVETGMRSLHPKVDDSPERQAYRELWRSFRLNDETASATSLGWAAAHSELKKGGDVDDVMNAILRVVGQDRIDVALDAAQKTHDVYNQPTDAT
ncbi:hypothetical protein SAMN05216553_102472 [Lentzea fradiae]|uniref:Uncharacterized protein n=1 Tax=Lentzea fradiae TaxID=200378 RepID=A0A1G7MS18_9PSEU|nr:hypothetical protein [Lentzea fradiae]SDF64446.1 hypothetical protein SAMN05216553_102472 [Lentzea fradiae]